MGPSLSAIIKKIKKIKQLHLQFNQTNILRSPSIMLNIVMMKKLMGE